MIQELLRLIEKLNNLNEPIIEVILNKNYFIINILKSQVSKQYTKECWLILDCNTNLVSIKCGFVSTQITCFQLKTFLEAALKDKVNTNFLVDLFLEYIVSVNAGSTLIDL